MPRISLLLTAPLALVLALAPGSAPGADDSRSSSVDPDSGGIVPACWSPQAFDPPQSLGDAGGSTSTAPVMAWNGTDYGSLMMSDYSGPRFLHVYADGSPSLPPTFLPSLPPGSSGYPNIYDRPALVWTGSGYGAAWIYRDTTASRYLVAFALLSPDGVVQGAVQRASFVGVAPTADASAPAIGWNATTGNFLVVWQDSRSGNNDIYGSVFKGSGSLSNVGTHDLLMSRDGSGNPLAGNQQNPTVASSPAGSSLALVAWEDGRGSPNQIWGRTLNLYTDGKLRLVRTRISADQQQRRSLGALAGGHADELRPGLAGHPERRLRHLLGEARRLLRLPRELRAAGHEQSLRVCLLAVDRLDRQRVRHLLLLGRLGARLRSLPREGELDRNPSRRARADHHRPRHLLVLPELPSPSASPTTSAASAATAVRDTSGSRSGATGTARRRRARRTCESWRRTGRA